jgi:hypothetical protein
MHWSEANDLNIKTLRRIVALLLALAGLAERASVRSDAVRWSVIWLLRPAEAIARDYVAGLTGDASLAMPDASDGSAPVCHGPVDAICLADTFRALAAALAAFAQQMLTLLQAGATNVRRAGPGQCAMNVLASLLEQLPAAERRDSS